MSQLQPSHTRKMKAPKPGKTIVRAAQMKNTITANIWANRKLISRSKR